LDNDSWHLKKHWYSQRRNSEARTDLQEAVDAETVRLHAPTFLREEVENNIREMAAGDEGKLATLIDYWDYYQGKIQFWEVGGADQSLSNAKDAPYLKLQNKYYGKVVNCSHIYS